MTVISRHHGANNLITRQSNEEKLVTRSDFLLDHEGWSIVGRLVAEYRVPERDDLFAVSNLRKGVMVILSMCAMPPNARTDRRGRPVASELETDAARPRSVQ